jgi:hypothetical protein
MIEDRTIGNGGVTATSETTNAQATIKKESGKTTK